MGERVFDLRGDWGGDYVVEGDGFVAELGGVGEEALEVLGGGRGRPGDVEIEHVWWRVFRFLGRFEEIYPRLVATKGLDRGVEGLLELGNSRRKVVMRGVEAGVVGDDDSTR